MMEMSAEGNGWELDDAHLDPDLPESRFGEFDEILDLIIHELRTPLAVMKGFASMFQRSVQKMDREAVLAGAGSILRGADRLDALLTTLKDVRSLETNEMDLKPENVLVSELVNDAVFDQTSLDHDHPITTIIEDDALLFLDAVRIRQVLANLLSNAVKFSPKNTSVDLTVSRNRSMMSIEVRDHGPGVPSERAGELFGKFSRLGATEKGTGIGLYISRGIARAHGGELELVLDGAEGCCFRLLLPIHAERTTGDLAVLDDHRPR